MTYAIWVREQGADREVMLCHVGTNPQQIVRGLKKKTLRVDIGLIKLEDVPKYQDVRIEEI